MNFKLGKFLLILIIVIVVGFVLTNFLTHTYIKAEFNKMDPLPEKMGVYYKGYKLGTTKKVKISKDFKTTYLYISLNQRGLHLPRNITAQVKNYDADTKYVDIIYPKAPYLKYIRTGDIIKGELSTGSGIISDLNQAHLDNLSEKGENLLTSATKTTDSLTELFDLITDILTENRTNIKESTQSLKSSMENLNETTSNLKVLTSKVNLELSDKTLKTDISNIEKATSNLAKSSENLVKISENFNQASFEIISLVPKFSSILDTVQVVICNLNEILAGLKKTLIKRFGGVRLIFGKPISE